MSPESPARPSQVTAAGWSVTVVAAVLVVLVYEAMSGMSSVETSDALAKAAGSGWAHAFGLDVDAARSVVRAGLLVSGAAAAAACVLGPYVLRRHGGARIALSAAAVLVVLGTLVARDGGVGTRTVLSIFLAASTTVLWDRPARDWFAGREPRVVEAPRPAPTAPPAAPPSPPVPSAQAPYPQAPYPPAPYPPMAAPPGWPPPYPPAGRTAPMPSQLRIACILTWIFAGLTGLAYLVLLAVLVLNQDLLMQEVRKSPSWDSSYDEHTVLVAAGVVGVLFVLWCVGAMILAWFTWRGETWAWILLSVSAGVAALVCVLAVPFSLVHLLVCGVSTGMLLGAPTRRWFAERQRSLGR